MPTHDAYRNEYHEKMRSYTAEYREKMLSKSNRMAILHKLSLLDAERETFFDTLTDIASHLLEVPVSLVSLVAANYQFFKSSTGLPEPWNSERRTPLSHSFCQHVVVTGEPLIVEDAREVNFLKDNLAIPDLDVISYLGMPLTTDDGERLGSFCVIGPKPHKWTADEIKIVEAFSRVVNAEIDARATAYHQRELESYIATYSSKYLEGLKAKLLTASTTTDVVRHLDAITADIGKAAGKLRN
ncbi:MAG: GAF domain-containing protein [Chloroflexota bacterium]